MDTKTQHGYLLLADISGYTSYLASAELEHAHEILTELLELLVSSLTPAMTLAKLEGDAVFAYAPAEQFSRGEALLELIEATYVAFRRHVDRMERHTTCACKACRSLPALDLKFLVHHGDYVVQTVAGVRDLVGTDVNLIHRLLKNHVSEATGWQAYVLLTRQSLAHTHTQPELLGMHMQTETYDHLGTVETFSLNLHERYKEIMSDRRVALDPQDADIVIVQDFAAPVPAVWEWLNDPSNRSRYGEGAIWKVGARPRGRTGPGALNHCAHGRGQSLETILDWRPYQYATSEMKDGPMRMMRTVRFESAPGGAGTRVTTYLSAAMALPRWLRQPLFRFFMIRVYQYGRFMANAAQMLEREGCLGWSPEQVPA